MPTARSLQVDLNTTPFYHCYARCVRRAKLFWKNEKGDDCLSRRDLIVARLKQLAGIFSIQICAYAIMQNHYHLVLHVDQQEALAWDDAEVLERLKRISPKQGANPTPKTLSIWRERFCNISWFMRFLNEYIARIANKEDDVSGHFWEERFKSQALIDDGALLACMAYVDLNPIRATQAETLETSEHTSIQERLKAYADKTSEPSHLMPCQSTSSEITHKNILPFSKEEYISLVTWTGQQIRDDKKGYLATGTSNIPSIVKENGLNPVYWLSTIKHYNTPYQHIAGPLSALRDWATKIGQKWLKGQTIARLRYLKT